MVLQWQISLHTLNGRISPPEIEEFICMEPSFMQLLTQNKYWSSTSCWRSELFCNMNLNQLPAYFSIGRQVTVLNICCNTFSTSTLMSVHITNTFEPLSDSGHDTADILKFLADFSQCLFIPFFKISHIFSRWHIRITSNSNFFQLHVQSLKTDLKSPTCTSIHTLNFLKCFFSN